MSKERDRGPVIAVCGKGGVGKTTVSALLASALAEKGSRRVLAVDADHAGGLTMALGLAPERTLADVRLAAMEEVDAGGVSRGDLARSLDYQLLDTLHEHESLALLPMGRPRSRGCYCAVNRLLREAVARLSADLDVTIVDAEAGVEQLNREVLSEVDTLLLVADTSAKALAVAETAAAMIGSRSEARVAGLVINRVRTDEEARAAAARTSLEVIATIREDEEVRRFDAEERSFLLLRQGPAREAIGQLARHLGLVG